MTRFGRNQEVYPHIEDEIGEDPARFLDRKLDKEALRFIESRIFGIDRFEVLAAWGKVERNLIRTPDGSHNEAGRRRILDMLERRARELQTLGDREEQLEHRLYREAEDDQNDEEDEPTVWRHEPCGSTDVDRESKMAWFCEECEQRTNRVEEVEAPEVAA